MADYRGVPQTSWELCRGRRLAQEEGTARQAAWSQGGALRRNFTGFGHFSPFHLFPGKDRENPQPGKQAAEVSHRSYKHVFLENMPFACNFRENEINSLCPEGELIIKKKNNY